MDGASYEESILSRLSSTTGDDQSRNTHEDVATYYGEVLSQTSDLKTNCCTTAGAPPAHIKRALSNVHNDVLSRYYGCGFIAPDLLHGLRVLDLGCGSGRDCYVLAQMVGESGHVVGIDMCDEQLKPARDTIEWHRERFGYTTANTTFLKGYIERLGELGLEENSFDLIVSNCVINLSPDKPAVLKEAYRLLKPGGELYFSDVYSSQRVPLSLRRDSVLWGECLSGALYWNDFMRLARESGFGDPRLVTDSPLSLGNARIEQLIGHIQFFSATYRLWKLLPGLEPDCEDYGQAVCYRGSIPSPDLAIVVSGKKNCGGCCSSTKPSQGEEKQHLMHVCDLDGHHSFRAGKIERVCGNTFRMLKESRFASHFDFFGDFSNHFGIFEGCGKGIPFKSGNASNDCAAGTGSCC